MAYPNKFTTKNQMKKYECQDVRDLHENYENASLHIYQNKNRLAGPRKILFSLTSLQFIIPYKLF